MARRAQQPTVVRALFNRKGEPQTRVTIGHQVYQQDQVLEPLPLDAKCAVCIYGPCIDTTCPYYVPATKASHTKRKPSSDDYWTTLPCDSEPKDQ